MPRKVKKELTPDEKKQQIQEAIEECKLATQENNEMLAKLKSEYDQIKPLGFRAISQLVGEEIEDIMEELEEIAEHQKQQEEELKNL